MKLHLEVEMTPEEARRVMGLPDVTKFQDEMMQEMQKRLRASMEAVDPEAMLRLWAPFGAQGFEQFQRLFWDTAKRAAGGGSSKAGKQER
ncbi:MAG: hypothetical protein JOZ55_01090 [Alphaproteobacteria bacterium]|nr:hypothetical protein [Alphaproteobacteria bacterium]